MAQRPARRADEAFPDNDPREALRQGYLEGRYEYVSVVARDADACPACGALADRGYVPWELPEVPRPDCSGADGCRCRYEPAITVVE